MEDSTKLRQRLRDERPAITDALKSFCSWMLARTTSTRQFSDWTSHDILSTTRWLSLSINRHIAAISSRDEQEKMIVTQVWNEVVGQQQKVTKTLGRTSLRNVWKDLDVHSEKAKDDVTNEKRKLYLELFERFLFAPSSGEAAISNNRDSIEDDDDSLLDARLIWDPDRGAAEFARRATRRQENAASRIKEEEEERKSDKDSSESNSTPCIEELKSDPGDERKV